MAKETMQEVKIPVVRLADIAEHLRTPLYRNGYLLILSTVLTSVLGFGYWAIAANLYKTEDVGLNSAAISVMIFLAGIAQLNLQEAMIRFVPLTGRRTIRFVIYSYLIVLALSAGAGLVFCLGIAIWSPRLNFITEHPLFMVWFILAVMMWGIFVVEDAVLTGLRQTVWVPLENTIFSIAKIVMLVLFALTIPATGIFISWAAATLLVVIPINYLLFRRLLPRHVRAAPAQAEKVSIRQLVAYVAGNYVAALLVNMSTVLIPVIITQMLGAVANAHFYLTWVLASALQVISSNMATSLTVEGTLDKQSLTTYQWRVLLNIYRLLVPIVLLMIVAAPLVLRLMGAAYADGVLLLRLLVLAALPNAINIVYTALARVKNRVRTIILIYGANAIIVLTLSFLLLPHLGITVVGLAWVVSQTGIATVVLIRDRNNVSSVIRKLLGRESHEVKTLGNAYREHAD